MQKISIDKEWVVVMKHKGDRRLQHDCAFVTHAYHSVGDELVGVTRGDCNVRCPEETIAKFRFIVESFS